MSEHERLKWIRLDNAAKVFPPTVKKTDTRVFRFNCRLFEDIQPELLQSALDKVVAEFPHFLYVIRQGLFWYYFEQSKLKPVVTPENEYPCGPLYIRGSKTLLFSVTYFKKRINLEMFHSLADGTGAMQFFRALVLEYLIQSHRAEFGENLPFLRTDASFNKKQEDSFSAYYDKEKAKNEKQPEKSYVFKGAQNEDDSIHVIEGSVNVKEVLALAHKYNTTLTGFIVSVYIKAIAQEMSLSEKKKPIVIGIPVDLRQFFNSATSRNFFGVINISYKLQSDDDPLERIIESVTASMKQEITKERLSQVMNAYSGIEHNFIARIAPLPLKDLVVKIARANSDKYCTSAVSNLGVIDMPEEVRKFIHSFSVYASTLLIQLCLCSFDGRLELAFSSAIQQKDVQKNFFRTLTSLGAGVRIYSND